MSRFFNVIQGLPIPMRMRRAMLRRHGITISDSATVVERVYFGSGKCVIGEGSFISIDCLIDGSDSVTLGRNVYLAMGVYLITSSHEIGPVHLRAGKATNAPITIGDGAWLGAGCRVLPGVMIAEGCVIASGAVVTKNTEANGTYAGVPARRVRDID